MRLPPTYAETGALNAIIETPKHSNCKMDYDPQLQLFRVAKGLPLGMAFPFDFGFLPATLGEDGDPLDIMVLCEQSLPVGVLATVSLLGVLEAEQTDRDRKKPIRNDRLIGCLQSDPDDPETSYSDIKKLPKRLRRDIEAFFIQYNVLDGKKFRPLGWHGPKRARALIEAGMRKAEKA